MINLQCLKILPVGRMLLLIMSSFYILCSTPAIAATFCQFESPYSVTIPSAAISVYQFAGVNNAPYVRLTPSWISLTETSAIKTDCYNGRGYLYFNQISGNAQNVVIKDTNTGDSGGSNNYSTFFRTTIPGIVYEVAIICRAHKSNGCDGGIRNNQTLPLGATNNWGHLGSESYPWDRDSQTYGIYMRIYQTPDYKWAPGQTVAHPIAGRLTTLQMSDFNTDVLTNSAISINLLNSFPTCSTAVVAGTNVSGNTLALGEYDMDDLNRKDPVPFSLKMTQCVGTKVKVKLNTNSREDSSQLLKNTTTTSSGSTGVALRIKNGSSTVVPDGSSTFSVSMTGSTTINLTAQLEKNGKSTRPGSFTSQAVFTISYE
ncbi:fimbrial protein [Buttiauxella ferragutiae]|uniref:fimbrial protein n=1 Tax=Buttiauxella ferragutiae TaxID=82989 RepID=UPI001F53E022|nr:fimbrial protein [Buttiauxella ferragutiae]UNK60611.1 fimbrial protein [Buttiauxella ferragutiae]